MPPTKLPLEGVGVAPSPLRTRHDRRGSRQRFPENPLKLRPATMPDRRRHQIFLNVDVVPATFAILRPRRHARA